MKGLFCCQRKVSSGTITPSRNHRSGASRRAVLGRSTKMLILTRRVGETLVVGDDVTVTVLGVKGNQVRLGVNAPKDVSVHREEIYQRIQNEKRSEAEKDIGNS